MRVLVTGGSGFIGTNLIEELSGRVEVLSLDTTPPRKSEHQKYWRQVDVRDGQALSKSVKDFDPDRVIHLGARTDLRGSEVDEYSANTIGVENLIGALRALNKDVHTVYASSRLVFAIDHRPQDDWDYRPSTAYGASKIRGELIVREHASNAGTWSIVRPTSIWGPWFDTPYRDFFDMVANGRYVKFKNRDPLKSFGYVGNAVYELQKIALGNTDRVNGRVFWLTDYEPLRLSQWADLVAEALGRPHPRYAPWALARVAARVGDVATRLGVSRVPLTSFRLSNLVTDMTYDASSTEQIVGPLPYNLADGVRRTVEWYLANASAKL